MKSLNGIYETGYKEGFKAGQKTERERTKELIDDLKYKFKCDGCDYCKDGKTKNSLVLKELEDLKKRLEIEKK